MPPRRIHVPWARVLDELSDVVISTFPDVRDRVVERKLIIPENVDYLVIEIAEVEESADAVS